MPFEVFDFRTANRNVLVTPEIRARLYHMQPGQVDARHSHDLGHEVFLILEGMAEFNINGDKQVLGPGQLCIARSDEIHQVRNVLLDQPTIMYLSVTPHVQPTHTGRDESDAKLPPKFAPNSVYHVTQDLDAPLAELVAHLSAAAQALAAVAQENAATQAAQGATLFDALASQDQDAAVAARNAMWQTVYALHKQLYAFDALWNDVAPRVEPQA